MTWLALLSAGCGSVPGRGLWGEHATVWPGWRQIGNAAVAAAADPKTWMPAAGAAVFSIGDLDERVSDWAVEHTPVFGGDAARAGDNLRDATSVAYAATALAAPSGHAAAEWTGNKAKGFAVGLAAIGINDLVTLGLKDLANKERPDRSNRNSFPSGHASQAASRATLAAKNLDDIHIPAWSKTTLKAVFYSLAAGTGWAQVEAQRHFPSDVLAGFALGHFFGAFINDAFLAPLSSSDAAISLEAAPGGLRVSLSLAF